MLQAIGTVRPALDTFYNALTDEQKAAFDAIASTLQLGSVSFENAFNERGERYVWLPPNVVDRLKARRRPGEGYSDVILRIAAER